MLVADIWAKPRSWDLKQFDLKGGRERWRNGKEKQTFKGAVAITLRQNNNQIEELAYQKIKALQRTQELNTILR